MNDPIPLETPVETPAIPAKTYPYAWYGSVGIVSSPTRARATILVYPMAEDGTVLPDPAKTVTLDEAMVTLLNIPEVAALYDALKVAVPAIEAWQAAENAPSPEPEPAPNSNPPA